jgi:hypothetical protein
VGDEGVVLGLDVLVMYVFFDDVDGVVVVKLLLLLLLSLTAAALDDSSACCCSVVGVRLLSAVAAFEPGSGAVVEVAVTVFEVGKFD